MHNNVSVRPKFNLAKLQNIWPVVSCVLSLVALYSAV